MRATDNAGQLSRLGLPKAMQAWSSFYSVTAGAAATLLGLLFVAVSVGAGDEFAQDRSTTRALGEQAFQTYLTVLVVSAIALFPDASASTTGIVTLVVTASAATWAMVRLVQAIRRGVAGQPRLATYRRYAISLGGLLLLFAAALRLSLGRDDSFHMFAAAVLTLIVSSATISWELLLRLVQARSGST